jgi:hypothetical protein
MENKETEQPESLGAFHHRQNSEGGGIVTLINPGMTREEAIKYLGLSQDLLDTNAH